MKEEEPCGRGVEVEKGLRQRGTTSAKACIVCWRKITGATVCRGGGGERR